MLKTEFLHSNTLEGWRVHCYDRIGSTNDIARSLPPWNAVRADSQTSGRGRHGRPWISERGGLWLSMVVPMRGERRHWSALPLAAGWAVLGVIKGLGIREARLRWPNDIMVRDMKLAGLLVEQFREGVAVVGVGINVFNCPNRIEHELTQKITRLSDHISPAPCLNELTEMTLKNLKNIHHQMEIYGFSALLDKINTAWSVPRFVELSFERGTQKGLFLGINGEGDIIIKTGADRKFSYAPIQVKLFREIYNE
ncbi:MAG: biotin--[acetyl-CoA-carboxylase] ligase [Candidatus Brocadiaceae bacterium]